MAVVFYPSCVVNFTLVFDESLHVVPDPPAKGLESALKAADDALGSFADKLVPLKSERPPGSPPLISERGDKNQTFVMNRVPRSATIELPGYRQAGKFSITIDFKDLPIDPRTARSCMVEIHMGTVRPEDFGAGVIKGDVKKSTLNTRTASGDPNPETMLIFGQVDVWKVKHASDGSTVTMSGRDLRGMLLDIPIAGDPKAPQQVIDMLDLSQPVHEVIKQLYGFMPYFAKMQICVNEAEWPDSKIPAPGKAASVPHHRKGAKGKRKGAIATPPGGSGGKISFWDMTVRICYLVGAIPYFVRNELHIRPAKSIYAQQAAGDNPMQPTPFRDGRPRSKDAQSKDSIAGGPLRVRRLVYGRDIEEVEFERKMGGYQRPTSVRVVNVDGSAVSKDDKLLQAIWPEPKTDEKTKKAKTSRVAPNNKAAMQETINVPVSGITDVGQLKVIAESIYNEIGRGEIGGSCETTNLASFGGDNTDADLLRLRPGDGIEFAVDKRALKASSPLVSTLTDFYRTGFDVQVKQLKDLLGSENLARVIVATARGQVQELQRFFRVSNVHYTWQHERGVSLNFDFQNFVEVRNDVDPIRLDPSKSSIKRAVVG